MLEKVCLRNVGSGGVVDVPRGDVNESLEVYQDHHGGDNQQFYLDEKEGQIMSELDKILVLSVEDNRIVLSSKKSIKGWRLDRGKTGPTLDDMELEDDCLYIGLIRYGDMVMTDRGGQLVIENERDECPHQTWEVLKEGQESRSSARPATSCHLTFPLPQEVEDTDSWQLESSLMVQSSCPATYFCVLGWGPGGYSGVQEIDSNKRVAIFSMWNIGCKSVSLLSHGGGVTVSKFGGEGTGLKAMLDFTWVEGEVITFIVRGRRGEGGWTCDCQFNYKGKTKFMASYFRPGEMDRPLSKGGFYTFVEDWDRGSGAEGHTVCRKAEFMDQRIILWDKVVELKEAKFTKVENGRDKYAKEKAKGGILKDNKRFFLSSGGENDSDICVNGTCFSLCG